MSDDYDRAQVALPVSPWTAAQRRRIVRATRGGLPYRELIALLQNHAPKHHPPIKANRRRTHRRRK